MFAVPVFASLGLMLIGAGILAYQTYDWWRRHFWQDMRVGETFAGFGLAPADVKDPQLHRIAEWIYSLPLGPSLLAVGFVTFVTSVFLMRLKLRLEPGSHGPHRAPIRLN